MKTYTKEEIVAMLDEFISQRSGIDWRDYGGDREAFMGDYRPMLKDGKTARYLLSCVENSSMTVDDMLPAFRAFSGRLSLTDNGLEYCTGQYFPTEYRKAACAVLAQMLWDYYREPTDTGDMLRKKFRRMFGRGIANQWFN